MIMLFFERYSSQKHTSEEKIHKSYVQIIFFPQQMEELDNHHLRVAKISLKQKRLFLQVQYYNLYEMNQILLIVTLV